MKKILMLLVVPVYLLLLAGFTCNETAASTGEPGKASFWKKSATAETHYLYIDNTEKGLLPFLPDSLTTAGNDIVQKLGLTIILKPRSYAIVVKDSSGTIFCEGTLYLKRTENSKEIKASWENDQCMVDVVYN